METTASRRAGFSLVELLVVITVIALLAVLLVPAFGRARERARQVVCTGNLRQIGQAAQMYHDVHGRLPTSPFAGYLLWNGTDYVLYGRLLAGGDRALGRSFYCPSARLFAVDSTATGLANLGQAGKLTAGAYECRSEPQGAPRQLDPRTVALVADLFAMTAQPANHADGVNVLSTDGSVRFWPTAASAAWNAADFWNQLDSGTLTSGL